MNHKGKAYKNNSFLGLLKHCIFITSVTVVTPCELTRVSEMNSPKELWKLAGFSPSLWKDYFKNSVHLFPKAAWDFQPLASYVWLILLWENRVSKGICSLILLVMWYQRSFCKGKEMYLKGIFLSKGSKRRLNNVILAAQQH